MKKATLRDCGSSPSTQTPSLHRTLIRKLVGPGLLLLLFLLTLAACKPGGAASTSTSAATGTTPQATISVPHGYRGLIQVTFMTSTSYAQAVAIIENAGLYLPPDCTGPGRLPLSPVDTPLPPKDQQLTFAQTHQLIVGGKPTLTDSMVNQVAAASQVVQVGIAPKIYCPVSNP